MSSSRTTPRLASYYGPSSILATSRIPKTAMSVRDTGKSIIEEKSESLVRTKSLTQSKFNDGAAQTSYENLGRLLSPYEKKRKNLWIPKAKNMNDSSYTSTYEDLGALSPKEDYITVSQMEAMQTATGSAFAVEKVECSVTNAQGNSATAMMSSKGLHERHVILPENVGLATKKDNLNR